MILLIVEDEDIIRKGLIVTLKKLQLEFDRICEAGDGEEGLRLCREVTPDIIITDIRMPLMDGLTFIRESQKLVPDGQYIILSGYSDFQYARTALQYGVKDYLLKPSTKNEIRDVLTRVITQMKENRTQKLQLEEQIHSYEKKLDRFQELLLGNILSGRYPAPEIRPCLAHYSITLREEMLTAVCIRIAPVTPSDVSSVDYRCHFQWLASLFAPFAAVHQADILSVYKCLLLNFSRKAAGSLQKLQRTLEDTIREYGKQHHLMIHLSLSRQESSPELLPELYQEACSLLHCRLFVPDTVFFDPKLLKNRENAAPAVPLTMIETLCRCYLGNSQFELRRNFYGFFRHVTGIEDASPDFLAACMEKLAEAISVHAAREGLQPENTYPIDFGVSAAITSSDSLESLADTLYAVFLNHWKSKQEGMPAAASTAASPVDHAIAYIEQNYYLDLDLTMISDLISMNSSYFSSLFKKKTGLNFITYLQNVRIEKSKQLLLNTNQKLYEISETVGIPNVKYFCKLFKDCTGVTPSEFRKNGSTAKLP